MVAVRCSQQWSICETKNINATSEHVQYMAKKLAAQCFQTLSVYPQLDGVGATCAHDRQTKSVTLLRNALPSGQPRLACRGQIFCLVLSQRGA